MTETLERPAAETGARAPDSPAARVQAWLSDFESALTAGDAEAAAAMFDEDSYWRDLVAFTWNIKTVEGPQGVRELLAATLQQIGPYGFAAAEEPTGTPELTEA
ncbi:MAG: NAD(P)/FAD-dependent oxidoreductase, partial [Actinomycetota bacterium]|nr:NAD(P)/FAD-dependent oxidoreductase [Actinomycetota bacterium]